MSPYLRQVISLVLLLVFSSQSFSAMAVPCQTQTQPEMITQYREPLKNVGEAASARQKQAKKRSLYVINEHFESVFNAAIATQVIFQRFPNHHMHPMGHPMSSLAATDMYAIHALATSKNDDKHFADHNCCETPGHCFTSSCAHFTVNPSLVIITQQQSILAIPFQLGVLPLAPDTSLYRPPIFA